MSSEKQFTIEELKEFNGKNGKPAYVACKGKVYDVTDDYLWADGEHQGEHSAGTDLTENISRAPHMEDVLDRVKFVGILKT